MPDATPRLRQDRRGDKVRRTFDRVASAFAESDFLYREMARRMDERLELVRIAPSRILDAGCGLGSDRSHLTRRYPEALWLGLDQSLGMLRYGAQADNPSGRPAMGFLQRLLRSMTPVKKPTNALRVVGALDALPLAGQQIDFIWSNAALHWLNDLPLALKEFNRVLKVGGLLMFSTFGPDTLKELRGALLAAAGHGQQAARIYDFIDMHDVGDMLVHAGFSDPVMDMETLTLTYADPWQALRELQQAGSMAPYPPIAGLTPRAFWERVFEHWLPNREGRYPLTFELVQGHAWKVAPRQHDDGRAIVNFMPRPGQPQQRD